MGISSTEQELLPQQPQTADVWGVKWWPAGLIPVWLPASTCLTTPPDKVAPSARPSAKENEWLRVFFKKVGWAGSDDVTTITSVVGGG